MKKIVLGTFACVLLIASSARADGLLGDLISYGELAGLAGAIILTHDSDSDLLKVGAALGGMAAGGIGERLYRKHNPELDCKVRAQRSANTAGELTKFDGLDCEGDVVLNLNRADYAPLTDDVVSRLGLRQ